MNVLLVDDDNIILKILHTAFKKAEIECKACYNPNTAIDEFKKSNFDIVITDFQMPRVNGVEVLRQVREVNPDVPVIMICGFVNEYIKKQALSGGISAYFEKPLDVDKLIDKCKELVEKYKDK